MRLRNPKLVYSLIAVLVCSIFGVALALDYLERRRWPKAIPNPGTCIVANQDADTQARADQIVAAINQFEIVNKVAPGSLSQLTPTYIDRILNPVSPIKPWFYQVAANKSWQMGYTISTSSIEHTYFTYSSRSRKWDSVKDTY